MFSFDIKITAQQALEISCEKVKELELKKLKETIQYHCGRFNRKVQIRQEDFSVIDVKQELTKMGIPFSSNVRESYDCDLSHANFSDGWFKDSIKRRDEDARRILDSVAAHIRSAAEERHRHTEWAPDGNHQNGYDWRWLIKSLESNGFSACLNKEGDIRIDW